MKLLHETTLAISTQHMTEFLPVEDSSSVFGNLRYIHHHFGIIVFIGLPLNREENPQRFDAEALMVLFEVPNWLRPIIQYCIDNECYYINFDEDISLNQELYEQQLKSCRG